MSKKWKAAVLLLVVLALAAAFAFSRLRWEKSWNFSESVRTLRNPARGFYIQVDSTRWQKIEKISGDVRVILLTLDLRDFAEQAIPDATMQELKLPLQKNSSFYENALKLIDGNSIDIDTLLNSLVFNNIASINKTLQFND